MNRYLRGERVSGDNARCCDPLIWWVAKSPAAKHLRFCAKMSLNLNLVQEKSIEATAAGKSLNITIRLSKPPTYK